MPGADAHNTFATADRHSWLLVTPWKYQTTSLAKMESTETYQLFSLMALTLQHPFSIRFATCYSVAFARNFALRTGCECTQPRAGSG